MSLRISSREHLFVFLLLGVALVLVYNRRFYYLEDGIDERGYIAMTNAIAAWQPIPFKGLWPPFFPFLGSFLVVAGVQTRWALAIVSLVGYVVFIYLVWKACEGLKLGPSPAWTVALAVVFLLFGFDPAAYLVFEALFFATVWLYLKPLTWPRAVGIGLVAILAHETRYLGESLLPFFALVMLADWTRGKSDETPGQMLVILIAAAGMLGTLLLNYYLYGMLSGERSPSEQTLAHCIRNIGLWLPATWSGVAPIERLTGFVSPWVISAAVWACLLAALIGGMLAGDRRVRGMALAVIAYLGTVTAAEMSVGVNEITRTYLMPVAPLVVLLAFALMKRLGLRYYRLISYAALAAAICLAVVNVARGRIQ